MSGLPKKQKKLNKNKAIATMLYWFTNIPYCLTTVAYLKTKKAKQKTKPQQKTKSQCFMLYALCFMLKRLALWWWLSSQGGCFCHVITVVLCTTTVENFLFFGYYFPYKAIAMSHGLSQSRVGTKKKILNQNACSSIVLS